MRRFGHSRALNLGLLSSCPRPFGLGLLTTGVVCPCHVLVGLAGLLTGGSLLTPAAQDGLHAVYVPLAVLGGALLLRPRRADRSDSAAWLSASSASPMSAEEETRPVSPLLRRRAN